MKPTRHLVTLSLVIIIAAACGGNGTGPKAGAPVVNAGASTQLPAGMPYTLSATFNDTTANASPWSYDVDWGDGKTTAGSISNVGTISATHMYGTEGNYSVKVSVTNKQGETGMGSVSIGATAPVL